MSKERMSHSLPLKTPPVLNGVVSPWKIDPRLERAAIEEQGVVRECLAIADVHLDPHRPGGVVDTRQGDVASRGVE